MEPKIEAPDEKKYITRPFELKSPIDETGRFSGYGSVFSNIDSYADIVAPGAFKRSLREHKRNDTWPLMFSDHNTGKEIGEWTAIKEDDTGLYVEGKLWLDGPYPDQDALKAYRGMKKEKGKMGLSIGFSTIQSIFDEKKKVRTLTDVDLFEISAVKFPANGKARVESVKAVDAISAIKSLSEAEDFLRDAGSFSRSEATAFVSRLKAITQSDSGEGHKDDLAAHCYALANRMLLGK